MPDKKIKCTDCPTEFNFTEGEQTFYASKGLSAPRRCKPCREARKVRATPAPAPTAVPREDHEQPRFQQQPQRRVEWVGGGEPDRGRKSRRNDRRRDHYDE